MTYRYEIELNGLSIAFETPKKLSLAKLQRLTSFFWLGSDLAKPANELMENFDSFSVVRKRISSDTTIINWETIK